MCDAWNDQFVVTVLLEPHQMSHQERNGTCVYHKQNIWKNGD